MSLKKKKRRRRRRELYKKFINDQIHSDFIINKLIFLYPLLFFRPSIFSWTGGKKSSSICIPRKCYSRAAMIVADLQCHGLCKSYEISHVIDKVSKVLSEWNVSRTYNRTSNNCQAFIDQLCRSIDPAFDLSNFTGPLGIFLLVAPRPSPPKRSKPALISNPIKTNQQEPF